MHATGVHKRRRETKGVAGRSRALARGIVVAYAPSTPHSDDHESVTRRGIAGKLAALQGYEFAGEYDPRERYSSKLYFVPGRTLLCVQARELGIVGPRDLFGGVVPHRFVATKSITHPLVDTDADAPDGWSFAFPAEVAGAVLRGHSAFSPADALRAGRRLLAHGAVRVKPALAVGGRGQSVVSNERELEDVVASLGAQEFSECGVALEENLGDVTTYSVGRVSVGDLTATYFGTQKLTPDHAGAEVYGGSDLVVARGDFEALLALELPADALRAVQQARVYDTAAHGCFPGLMASRRNYDIAVGTDAATGERHCGVLEQSWRIGGASGAEVAALELFQADPSVHTVRASSVERYGDHTPPAGAMVYFDGVDEMVGRITKYTTAEPHVDA